MTDSNLNTILPVVCKAQLGFVAVGHFRFKEVQDGDVHGRLLCIESIAADPEAASRAR